ncbi:MAG TPA: hypothetical protein VN854_00050 [Mycoplasmatales bacterium]|nr:hypothetical protein [Mycoplasmatales bacterium]
MIKFSKIFSWISWIKYFIFSIKYRVFRHNNDSLSTNNTQTIKHVKFHTFYTHINKNKIHRDRSEWSKLYNQKANIKERKHQYYLKNKEKYLKNKQLKRQLDRERKVI